MEYAESSSFEDGSDTFEIKDHDLLFGPSFLDGNLEGNIIFLERKMPERLPAKVIKALEAVKSNYEYPEPPAKEFRSRQSLTLGATGRGECKYGVKYGDADDNEDDDDEVADDGDDVDDDDEDEYENEYEDNIMTNELLEDDINIAFTKTLLTTVKDLGGSKIKAT